MKINKFVILGISLLFLFSGCAKTDFQTYTQNPIIKGNSSIILLGVKGSKSLKYLQFMSDKNPPALNYNDLNILNDIIALKVDIPQEKFRIGVFSVEKFGFGGISSSYRYKSVRSKSITIDKKGIYLYGILDTDRNMVVQTKNKIFLERAKLKYKDLLKDLTPINFSW
jgi:hypothetical protein